MNGAERPGGPRVGDERPGSSRLRDAIDAIDLQLVERLNERARLVAEVGRIKQGSGAPIFQPEREAEVVRRVVQASGGPLPDAALEAIYREIMSAARAIQRPLTVAYLGPQGTFSELATLKNFGSSAQAAVVRVDRRRVSRGRVRARRFRGGAGRELLRGRRVALARPAAVDAAA